MTCPDTSNLTGTASRAGRVRRLTLRGPDGAPRRTVAALEAAPGLFIHRGPRECECTTCVEERTDPAGCPLGVCCWLISTAAGIGLPAVFLPTVAVARRFARDVAATVPTPFANPDPAVQMAAARRPAAGAAYDAARSRLRRWQANPIPPAVWTAACPDLDADAPDDTHHGGIPTAAGHAMETAA